jgi:hypothetical protein
MSDLVKRLRDTAEKEWAWDCADDLLEAASTIERMAEELKTVRNEALEEAASEAAHWIRELKDEAPADGKSRIVLIERVAELVDATDSCGRVGSHPEASYFEVAPAIAGSTPAPLTK